jgi:hypothetical protein
MLGAPVVSLMLISAVNWLRMGEGRRYVGAVGMLFGALLLATIATAWCALGRAAPALLVAGIVVSVLLDWLGYRVQRRASYEPPAEPILTTPVEPVPSLQSLEPEKVQEQPSKSTR